MFFMADHDSYSPNMKGSSCYTIHTTAGNDVCAHTTAGNDECMCTHTLTKASSFNAQYLIVSLV